MTTYRMHGTSDDTDTCEMCGKTELRSVAMLAILDEDGTETGELIYAGSTCAARMLRTRGTRVSAARVRDAASAAGRVRERARQFADEFRGITVNGYIAANHVGLMNATSGDVPAALTMARARHAELVTEIAAIDAGRLAETRFAKMLPTL